MSIIFSGKNGAVHCWCMCEHGPSPLPGAGSRAGMVCNHGLANMTGELFPHSFQLICNATLTLLHFLHLYEPCCCSPAMGLVPSSLLLESCRDAELTAGSAVVPGAEHHPRHCWEMLLQLLWAGSSTNATFNTPGHYHAFSLIKIAEK